MEDLLVDDIVETWMGRAKCAVSEPWALGWELLVMKPLRLGRAKRAVSTHFGLLAYR